MCASLGAGQEPGARPEQNAAQSAQEATQPAPATQAPAEVPGQTPPATPQTAPPAPPYQPKFAGDPAHSESEAQALGYMRVVLRAQREYKKRHDKFAVSLMELAG